MQWTETEWLLKFLIEDTVMIFYIHTHGIYDCSIPLYLYHEAYIEYIQKLMEVQRICLKIKGCLLKHQKREIMANLKILCLVL